jgi:hypothetical protein
MSLILGKRKGSTVSKTSSPPPTRLEDDADFNPLVRDPSFQIEAVVTCVNHADILAHTLPMNLHHFDRYVVVTAPEDQDTRRVARYWGATCVATDVFRTRWKEFRKGEGINEALAVCSKKAWLTHMDVDVALPPVTRTYLENAKLDTSMIYSMDRAEFKSYRDWQLFYGDPALHTAGQNCFVDTHHHGKKLGTRLHFGHAGGYIPLGFFQLWHADSGILEYQAGHTNAAREDNEFAMRWPRAKRGFLPELICYHLESEDSAMGVNWAGRKSKKFRHE